MNYEIFASKNIINPENSGSNDGNYSFSHSYFFYNNEYIGIIYDTTSGCQFCQINNSFIPTKNIRVYEDDEFLFSADISVDFYQLGEFPTIIKISEFVKLFKK